MAFRSKVPVNGINSVRVENFALKHEYDRAIALAVGTGLYLQAGRVAERAAESNDSKAAEYLRKAEAAYAKGGWYADAARVAGEKLGDKGAELSYSKKLESDGHYTKLVEEALAPGNWKDCLTACKIAENAGDYKLASNVALKWLYGKSPHRDVYQKILTAAIDALEKIPTEDLEERMIKELQDKVWIYSERLVPSRKLVKRAMAISVQSGDPDWAIMQGQRLADRHRYHFPLVEEYVGSAMTNRELIKFAEDHGLLGHAIELAREAGKAEKAAKLAKRAQLAEAKTNELSEIARN